MELSEIKLSSNELYRGRSFSFSLDTVRLPDGNTAVKEVLHHPGGVAVLAIEDGRLLVEHQFRYAVSEELIEIPAGKLDKIPGEKPEEAAQRELREETGYIAGRLVYLGKIYPSPGVMSEALYVYFATSLEKGQGRELDEDEFLETEWVPLDRIKDSISKGMITDAKLLSALTMAEARGLI